MFAVVQEFLEELKLDIVTGVKNKGCVERSHAQDDSIVYTLYSLYADGPGK